MVHESKYRSGGARGGTKPEYYHSMKRRFKGSRASVANSQPATKKYVKNALNTYMQGHNTATEGGTGVLDVINIGPLAEVRIGVDIVQGTDSGNRERNEVFISTVKWFASFRNENVAVPKTKQHVRCLIVEDHLPALPKEEKFFIPEDDTNIPIDFNPLDGSLSYLVKGVNPERYRVIDQWVIPLERSDLSGYGKDLAIRNFIYEFKLNKKLKYSDKLPLSADNINPCYRMFYFGRSENEVVNTADLGYQFRIETSFTS